jgi:glucose/arabinose dehydrogenase
MRALGGCSARAQVPTATLDGMSLRVRRVPALLVVTIVCCSMLVRTTDANAASSSVSIGAGLHGPSGLSATMYAKGLKHASALATDPQGRVWVATAAATDAGKDAIYMLGSPGATPQKVLTDVHTPLGLLWLGDTLYVSEHDGVLALRGFDGTTFASRTTIVSFPTATGEVNGIARGSDGRLYVGISAKCDACTPSDTYSASVVSFRTDGSDLQIVARDIRAPVGLAFFPGTDDLFVTMNQRDDLGRKTPGDWLSLVQQGQSWGFPSCYGQDTAKCASTPRPVAVLDRHAAVSGVAMATGQLGSSVGTGAIVAEWVTGKVQLVRLTRSDPGYTGKVATSLTGFANPVPVLLDPHGALFVGDWTTGRIYRITG